MERWKYSSCSSWWLIAEGVAANPSSSSGSSRGGVSSLLHCSSLLSVHPRLFSLCNILAANIISPTVCFPPLSLILSWLKSTCYIIHLIPSFLLLLTVKCHHLTFFFYPLLCLLANPFRHDMPCLNVIKQFFLKIIYKLASNYTLECLR